MKPYLFFFALMTFFSCSSQPENTCRTRVDGLGFTGKNVSTPGNNVYMTASNFDNKNVDCWESVKAAAKDQAMSFRLPVTVHVLDDLPDFMPPPEGGFYGTDEVRKKVIAQYFVAADHSVKEIRDPLGFGNY